MAKKNIMNHYLIPKHIKCSKKEKDEVYANYKVEDKHMPKILKNDSAIKHLDVKVGDLIKISRKSPTAGEIFFYRVVMNE
ncbi:DNA-directed RNA polymerase subunit H [Nanoarchaeota archaeon]